MLLKALFWTSVVVILMPREPALGFGHPGLDGKSLPAQSGAAAYDCGDDHADCTAEPGLFGTFQGAVLGSLLRVKADLERQDYSAQRHISGDN